MDAADSPSTSSKVIVQCTDPYDLFDEISSSLESRLPLGNLHWKSPTRPLRSIDKLNVTFIREARQKDSASNIRRHQIPGLRQTPYVKLFLLRCDDRDNYKDTARKEVKEWLKKEGIAQEGKSSVKGQERHDAFEYIIVHVVVPGTPTAAQPKSVKQVTKEASDSTDSVNSKSKWTGKNVNTIYDKLRADFGVVGKGSFERVAQIRIGESNVPSSPVRPAEVEELWQDLIEKLKAAILQSFDARVSQYEEDIKDRESQRALPGWNFCTFFILKEGLARGFENVGLIEDALTVYDELDAGLDKVVQDQANTSETEAAGSLLPFSQDLKPAIRKALDTMDEPSLNAIDVSTPNDLEELIDLEKKSLPLENNGIDYQQRILTNQVSALDLRLYMYTRKLRLLFRRARNAMQPAKLKLGGSQYDIGKLSEICAHALQFISFASRALRQDLYTAWGGQQGLSQQELQTQKFVIGNLVASWKVSAILQVLEECQISQILSDILSQLTSTESGLEAKSETPRPIPTPLVTKHPINKQIYLQSPLDHRQSPIIPLVPSPQPQREAPHVDSRERLALWAAEFFVVLRDIVKRTSSYKISTDRAVPENSAGAISETNGTPRKASGIRSAILKVITVSEDTSIKLYKMLTTYAYRCYKFANQMQASRHMILSLAQMSHNEGQLQDAIDWLERIPDLLDVEAKTSTDLAIFRLYLQCLDREARPDEYARCSIGILQFSKTKLGSLAVERAHIDLQDTLNELVRVSKHTQSYDLPFSSLFRIGTVARSISHTPRRDGFDLSLTLALCYKLTLSCNDEMVLTLRSTTLHDTQAIFLNSQGSVSLSQLPNPVQFVSHTTTSGWHVPSQLHIRLGNLHFVHTFPALENKPETNDPKSVLAIVPLMLYPRAESFSISSSSAAITDLTQASRVSVRAKGGDVDVSDVFIRIKPATGGFRLNLHATEMKSEDNVDGFQAVPSDGSLAFNIARLASQQAFQLEIPYTLENTSLSVVHLKIDTTYKIEEETFTMALDQEVSTFLPIVVNVQDIFQADANTLRFSAGPVGRIPLRIIGWNIDQTEAYTISQSSVSQNSIDVFPKLAASWVVRMKPRGSIKPDQRKVRLTVHYECTDELIHQAITTAFSTALADTDFTSLRALLLPHLNSRMSRLWTDHALEVAALTRQFPLWTFDEMHWSEVMSAIDAQTRQAVELWLQSWHDNHSIINISTTQPVRRTLRLLVDIPQPDLLIFSRLSLIHASQTKYLSVGRPVSASFHISCHENDSRDVEISFDISASPDLWLIGGRKRGTFHSPREVHTIPVILIPQKPGHLLLPTIELRGRLRETGNESSRPLSCEVEHQNQAQSILVVPGIYTTTVTTGHANNANHHVLLESRIR